MPQGPPDPDPYDRLTPRQRLEYRYFYDHMRRAEWDLRNAIFTNRVVPSEWKDLLGEPKTGKTRVTIRLDGDIVKFFRKYGPGWQTNVNEVLRAFLYSRLSAVYIDAEMLEPDLTDRPGIGSFERILASGRGPRLSVDTDGSGEPDETRRTTPGLSPGAEPPEEA